jgi:hypothetical protein
MKERKGLTGRRERERTEISWRFNERAGRRGEREKGR